MPFLNGSRWTSLWNSQAGARGPKGTVRAKQLRFYDASDTTKGVTLLQKELRELPSDVVVTSVARRDSPTDYIQRRPSSHSTWLGKSVLLDGTWLDGTKKRRDTDEPFVSILYGVASNITLFLHHESLKLPRLSTLVVRTRYRMHQVLIHITYISYCPPSLVGDIKH